MSIWLILESLLVVWDLTMKKGIDIPCTNWSRARIALLMSLRQGETNRHRGKKLWCGRVGLMKVSM